MASKSKLIRNLKPGDRFVVRREDGISAVVTVQDVHETRPGFCTGRRMWAVFGDYPWWWKNPVTAYSDERISVLSPRKPEQEGRDV